MNQLQQQPDKPVSTLQLVGACLMAGVAMVRCMVVIAPMRLFDVDPAIDPLPLAGLGPAGSMVLDLLLVCGAVVCLFAECRQRRGLDPVLLVLAILPLPVILLHAGQDFESMWRGSGWFAAVIGLVAAAHLARDHRMTVLMSAVLLSIACPLLLRGLVQVFLDHPQTVAFFQANKQMILEEKGWLAGTPEALIYERRLMQPEATGWFGFSNIFGSVIAAAVTFCAGVLLLRPSVDDRAEGGWKGVLFLVGLLGLGLVLLNGGLGAIVVAFAGLLLIMVSWFNGWLASPPDGRMVRLGLLGLLVLALVVVIVRGLLPVEMLQEKSLLFRWHYMTGALAMFLEHPLLGVGAGGFDDAYLLGRPMESPEEVNSAHSMWIDWLAAMGIVGACWVLLTMIQLWRGVGGDDRNEPGTGSMRSLFFPSSIVILCSCIISLWIEQRVIGTISLLGVCLGIVLMLMMSASVIRILERVSLARARWILMLAGFVLLLHAQIEMSLWQPGAAAWILLLVGLAAPAACSVSWGRWLLPIPLAACVLLLVFGIIPTTRQDLLVEEAAARLQSIGVMRQEIIDPGLRLQDPADAEEILQGLLAAGTSPGYVDHLRSQWNVLAVEPLALRNLLLEVNAGNTPAARMHATSLLDEAVDRMRCRHDISLALADQALRAAQRLEGDDRTRMQQLALETLDAASTRGRSARLSAATAAALMQSMADDRPVGDRLREALVEWIQLDPNSVHARVLLAGVLHGSEEYAEAASIANEAILIDEARSLDPLKQMPGNQREQMLRIIEDARIREQG